MANVHHSPHHITLSPAEEKKKTQTELDYQAEDKQDDKQAGVRRSDEHNPANF